MTSRLINLSTSTLPHIFDLHYRESVTVEGVTAIDAADQFFIQPGSVQSGLAQKFDLHVRQAITQSIDEIDWENDPLFKSASFFIRRFENGSHTLRQASYATSPEQISVFDELMKGAKFLFTLHQAHEELTLPIKDRLSPMFHDLAVRLATHHNTAADNSNYSLLGGYMAGIELSKASQLSEQRIQPNNITLSRDTRTVIQNYHEAREYLSKQNLAEEQLNFLTDLYLSYNDSRPRNDHLAGVKDILDYQIIHRLLSTINLRAIFGDIDIFHDCLDELIGLIGKAKAESGYFPTEVTQNVLDHLGSQLKTNNYRDFDFWRGYFSNKNDKANDQSPDFIFGREISSIKGDSYITPLSNAVSSMLASGFLMTALMHADYVRHKLDFPPMLSSLKLLTAMTCVATLVAAPLFPNPFEVESVPLKSNQVRHARYTLIALGLTGFMSTALCQYWVLYNNMGFMAWMGLVTQFYMFQQIKLHSKREDQIMTFKYGDRYRNYMTRTRNFFPRAKDTVSTLIRRKK